jgi:uncharacterized protein (TIGR02246 family)
MPARTPDEVPLLFARAFTAHDLESAVALYEPQAALVPQPGELVTGTEAIREALGAFFATRPAFDLEVRKVFRAGDIALVFADWSLTGAGPDGETISMSGQTSDVLRQQPDGSWLFVIDNPYGHGGAVSPGEVRVPEG